MTLINTHRAIVVAASAVFALCANTLTACDARAELGGTMPALQANEPCTQHAVPGSAVRVQSTVDAGGTTINAYATCDGLIFAYAWQGPTMPDLARLLGPYADGYRAKAATQLSAFGHLHASRVEQPDVVVESGGQMRSYVGRAWLPAAVPSGFSLADLR
ncbi:DUF2844 domain-containing protein [Paraburkholderia sabiae]|jgi:hypothetical protein|uniref:DUF2844 domain-containing protein n=1 Tax=Paraburkholderia sabiae TaxID=273251 RepID=A0ABU9Q9V0_9BURK|nr:DUF2844 domain-containing protein [Paraburkholderia sabiae]WJZ75247.1 DUF2844 domain-containing protein [Paraburkholderia sabiae]CAD6533899.1 hypothetical protein LMG24235_02770 [Paraburkholderia sabiae]CAG9223161.1 conserved exported hypothetical protein [Paraburkholderia sabiae]